MRISDWSSDVCSSDLSWALTDKYEWGGVELGQGFLEWTELGQDSGLDPLGMQRPIEVIYQSLVPGISTITLRYRYYSFFPFILRHYEENIRHPDPKEFRKFQRRCEALFALICTHGEADRKSTRLNSSH